MEFEQQKKELKAFRIPDDEIEQAVKFAHDHQMNDLHKAFRMLHGEHRDYDMYCDTVAEIICPGVDPGLVSVRCETVNGFCRAVERLMDIGYTREEAEKKVKEDWKHTF